MNMHNNNPAERAIISGERNNFSHPETYLVKMLQTGQVWLRLTFYHVLSLLSPRGLFRPCLIHRALQANPFFGQENPHPLCLCRWPYCLMCWWRPAQQESQRARRGAPGGSGDLVRPYRQQARPLFSDGWNKSVSLLNEVLHSCCGPQGQRTSFRHCKPKEQS